MRLHTRVDGMEGAPWIVLSNSLGSTHRMWDDQMDLLTRKYRVLRYDHRGHGESEVPGEYFRWDDLVDDVLRLMDEHEIDHADYMGLSMGLMTGLGLGIHHGDRFGRLVLCDGRADAPEGFRAMWDQRIAAIEAGGVEAIADTVIGTWLTEDWRAMHTERTAEIRAMMVATPKAGYLACCRCLKTLDYIGDLGKIGNETLCITGSVDPGAPPEVVEAIANAIPNARYVEIEGAAHIANINRPEAFNAAIADFLEIR